MAKTSPVRQNSELPSGYAAALSNIKSWIASARTRAVMAVNAELICLYWQVGQEILRREGTEGWGAKVVDRLAADIKRDMPDLKGFSPRNLRYMRDFAEAWGPNATWEEMLPRPVARLAWRSNRLLLDRVKDAEKRAWYAAQAAEHGWSMPILEAQIESGLRERVGRALTTFDRSLPASDSDLVREVIKDPYNFEFLNLSPKAKEKDLELALLNDVQSFLMEMGEGFALVGRQHRLAARDPDTGDEQEFFIDLLFYNYLLRRFIVIDLKIEDFRPEFAGKMSFYLTAVDEIMRQPGDGDAIGLILCPGRNKTVTEWALRVTASPIAVARYITGLALTEETPQELQPALPDLPPLASELSGLMEAADAAYDADVDEDRPNEP